MNRKGRKLLSKQDDRLTKNAVQVLGKLFLAKSKWVGVSFIKTYSMESPSKQKRNFQKAFFQQR